MQVSLSTFLVIGATSSLTYNVVGHIKTVIILMGGCMFFGDEMPLKKLAGISIAMLGIMWYSQVCPHLRMAIHLCSYSRLLVPVDSSLADSWLGRKTGITISWGSRHWYIQSCCMERNILIVK